MIQLNSKMKRHIGQGLGGSKTGASVPVGWGVPSLTHQPVALRFADHYGGFIMCKQSAVNSLKQPLSRFSFKTLIYLFGCTWVLVVASELLAVACGT